jgi:hypothetical protein
LADEGTLVAKGTLDPKALPGLAGPLLIVKRQRLLVFFDQRRSRN